MPETPIEASRVAFTVKGCIARCTFLAGFAYYEAGRNDFQKSYDAAYVVLMTLTFALAVVAVGLGSLVLYYLERCKSGDQQKTFVAKINNLYVRGCFRLFLLALLVYVLGLGRCGFVYYDGNTGAKYAVMTASIVFVPVLFWGLVVIVRAQLMLQHNEGVSTDRELLSASAVVEAADSAGALGVLSTSDFHASMIQQADTIASRAVYITSFCQSGVTRFIDTDHPLGYVYLGSMVLAYAAAALPAFLLAIEAIFINDTVPEAQTAIAVLLKPLHDTLGKCYGASFLLMSVGLAFMGWGCAYEDRSWVTLHCGMAAFAMMVLGYVAIQRSKAAVLRLETSPDDKKTRSEGGTRGSPAAYVTSVLTLVGNTGSQATISSGFIYMTVVSFGTSIAPQATISSGQKLAMLELSSITLATGLVAAVYSSLISFGALELQGGEQQRAFLERCGLLVKLCVMSYQVSLLGFLATFAMIGNVNYDTDSYVPTAIAAFGFLLMLGGWVAMNRWRTQAEEAVGVEGEEAQASTVSSEAINSRLAAQNLASNRALFFGGFAFFTVAFFVPRGNNAVIDDLYPTVMSLTFVLSLVVVVWSGIAGVNDKECTSLRVRVEFSRRAEPLFRMLVALSLVATVSFVGGFSLIGWIKGISTYSNYAPVMASGTALLVAAMVPVVAKLWVAYNSAASSAQNVVAAEAGSKLGDGEALRSFKRFTDQMDVSASQTSFIAGNVFYEILFAEAHGGLVFNFVYFVSATVTFISGLAVVLTSGLVGFAGAELVNDRAKEHFAGSLKALLVKRLLFALNSMSTFSWLVSLSVFGVVKYSQLHQLWEPALALSIVSLALLVLAFRNLHRTSNDVLSK